MISPSSTKPTVLELFAGAGGLALGLERAGLQSVGLIETDVHAVTTLRKNRPLWQIVHANVSNVSYEGFKADVVVGGVPCQPFSVAGKKLGLDDPRGNMFTEFIRCVEQIKPKLFMIENVKGLFHHDKGKTLKTILALLNSLEYNIQFEILNAFEYSVAQWRERLFIVGTKAGVLFSYPKPDAEQYVLRDVLQNVPDSKGYAYDVYRKSVLDQVPMGGNWQDLPSDVRKLYIGKIDEIKGGSTGMAKRLHWLRPSPTLLTSPMQKLSERCHPEYTRPLTVREYARIQSFPDDWEFYGSAASQYRQIGNAVPVNLAYALGKSIKSALQLVKVDSP